MISLLTTGGTIACTADPTGALVPTVTGEELVRAAQLEGVRVADLLRLDSSSISLRDLDGLIDRVRKELLDDTVTGIVLTHGTDSLEETAMALAMIHESDKPVVLTGAQRAFDHPDSDGPGNLRDAVEAARTSAGVLVAFGGRILPAHGVRKVHTANLDAFDNQAWNDRRRVVPAAPLGPLDVPVLAAYPGADGWVVDAAVERGVDGLVIEALGSGNMSTGFGEAAARALHAGVPVVVATRVPFGEVTLAYGGAGGGATLGELGALGAGELSAGQARIALASALAAGVDPAEVF
ncbi:asparaginase [Corynebacterium doosanense]|uniref:asparaginase n=1 Tax=Corynebacterium doosanense CAU 212 = DSM 45436 TaxID=558173 RepID=A0A097IH36_9CORY|nr:asparaginase [Corynebacterium doosanense]AIT61445.1 asparaginase [Corynebacterium doosanense CAU 212 = DSM 45436]